MTIYANPTFSVALISGCLLLVRSLRLRRVKQKHQLFNYTDLSAITLDDAQKIQLYIFELEFPFIAQKALEFALFRTYGIPSISGLLAATKQFSTKAHASKRMADTSILILEIIKNAPGSARSTAAIARMNYLHSLYQASGKISNDDLLYTLSLFLLEPIRWIERHEWRKLTGMEVAAIGVFWEKVGEAMRIDYSPLRSGEGGWRDGAQFMRLVEAWSDGYERRNMVPAQCNKDTADHTTALLLYSVPARFKDAGLKAITALMDGRLRRAMLYPDPPRTLQWLIDTALWTRKQVLRHLVLPRPYIRRKQIVSESVNPDGRINRLIWDAEPWYVPSNFSTRNSLQSWLDYLSDRPIPGDGGNKYMPQGFLTAEIGPAFLAGKGGKEMKREKEFIGGVMVGSALIGR